MPIERFYVEQQLRDDDAVTLSGKEFHHLHNVLRVKEGATVEVVNGKGQLASAIVASLKKKEAVLQLDQITTKARPSKELILAQAIPRMNRLDFILEKGTELGMTKIWLFPGEHGEKAKLTIHQQGRMHAITIAAMKQCGRLYLPEISFKSPLEEWSKLPYPALFGDVSPDAPALGNVLKESSQQDGYIFFIGPESGFSEKEGRKLQGLGAQGVSMNKNILRTDTAALAALSIVSHHLIQKN